MSIGVTLHTKQKLVLYTKWASATSLINRDKDALLSPAGTNPPHTMNLCAAGPFPSCMCTSASLPAIATSGTTSHPAPPRPAQHNATQHYQQVSVISFNHTLLKLYKYCNHKVYCHPSYITACSVPVGQIRALYIYLNCVSFTITNAFLLFFF